MPDDIRGCRHHQVGVDVPSRTRRRPCQRFTRVLKPGGRVSLFETINVLMSLADPDLFSGYDVTPVRDLAARVEAL